MMLWKMPCEVARIETSSVLRLLHQSTNALQRFGRNNISSPLSLGLTKTSSGAESARLAASWVAPSQERATRLTSTPLDRFHCTFFISTAWRSKAHTLKFKHSGKLVTCLCAVHPISITAYPAFRVVSQLS